VKKVVHEARRKMLNLEIKSKYARSDIIKMELYSLHLLLARSVHPIVWDSIETDTRNLVNSKCIKRRMVQKKKFRALIARERLLLNENVVRPNFVINKSSQNFSNEDRYGTKIKNCSGFMKVDQILKVWSLLSPKILI
jgi:hypothetical protein